MQHVHRFPLVGALVAVLLGGAIVAAQQSTPKEQESGEAPGQQSEGGFRFRTGVELVNVTATVTDDTGRFVPISDRPNRGLGLLLTEKLSSELEITTSERGTRVALEKALPEGDGVSRRARRAEG